MDIIIEVATDSILGRLAAWEDAERAVQWAIDKMIRKITADFSNPNKAIVVDDGQSAQDSEDGSGTMQKLRLKVKVDNDGILDAIAEVEEMRRKASFARMDFVDCFTNSYGINKGGAIVKEVPATE